MVLDSHTLDLTDLDSFLLSVEKRAYAMAITALRDREDALDVVQDAMLQLARRYRQRDAGEWRPLFYRILRNRINDMHRRRKVRRRFTGWLERPSQDDSEDPSDPFQQAPGPVTDDPAFDLERQQRGQALQDAVAALPARQQQAFMLRCWEGLSTSEAAAAMKCSEGSVKTHYFRALQTLKIQLEAHWS